MRWLKCLEENSNQDSVSEIIIWFLFRWLDCLWITTEESAWHNHPNFWQIRIYLPHLFSVILSLLNYSNLQLFTDSFLKCNLFLQMCLFSLQRMGFGLAILEADGRFVFFHFSLCVCSTSPNVQTQKRPHLVCFWDASSVLTCTRNDAIEMLL